MYDCIPQEPKSLEPPVSYTSLLWRLHEKLGVDLTHRPKKHSLQERLQERKYRVRVAFDYFNVFGCAAAQKAYQQIVPILFGTREAKAALKRRTEWDNWEYQQEYESEWLARECSGYNHTI